MDIQHKYQLIISDLLRRVHEEAIEEVMKQKRSSEAAYLNTRQAASYLGVSESTVNTLTKKGLLGYYQPGGKGSIKRFTKQHLEDYMKGL